MREDSFGRPRPPTLVECLEGVPDPRIDRTRAHRLVDILVIGLCALLSGGEGFTDMELFGRAKREWLKTFLELPGGIPTHDTFNRVFSALDPRCFLDCFVRWVQGICPTLTGEVVAIDGKALRRAPLCHPSGTDRLPGNHGLLPDHRERPRAYRDPPLLAIHRYPVVPGQTPLEGPARHRHGRVHPRHQGQEHHRTPFLPLQPVPGRKDLCQGRPPTLGRREPLHWTLDATLREDQRRDRSRYAAQHLATLRRIALNLIKKSPRQKVSQRQKRILAALDTSFLQQLSGR